MGKKPQPITRDTLTAIEAQKIGSGMPVTTQGVGGDARAMLLRFHANFPFLPIGPFPAAAATILFDASGAPIDVTIPDGTLWAWLVASGGAVYVGIPGIAPPSVAQQSIEGGFRLPLDYPFPLFLFGKRQLSLRGANNSEVSLAFYAQVDTGLGEAPQLGI